MMSILHNFTGCYFYDDHGHNDNQLVYGLLSQFPSIPPLRLCCYGCFSLFPHFNSHFPGEPGLAGFIEARNDWSGGDNWGYKMCKAPVKSSPPTNQSSTFYGPDGLPVVQPTVSQSTEGMVLLRCNSFLDIIRLSLDLSVFICQQLLILVVGSFWWSQVYTTQLGKAKYT